VVTESVRTVHRRNGRGARHAARVRALAAAAVGLGLAAGLAAAPAVDVRAYAEPPDQQSGGARKAFDITDERITESSGLAASTMHDGHYYTVNDSGGEPDIFALDETGEVVATVELGEVLARDWEAVSTGPDSRLWVGDIGDNSAELESVMLYRIYEPTELVDASAPWSSFEITYEDGPHDAEALLVHPTTGRVYVVTKALRGAGVYEGPEELATEGVNVFTRVADAPALVTDGAFTPDGSRVVLRTYAKGFVFDADWTKRGELALPVQPQGESLAVGADGAHVLAGSEGRRSAVYRVPLAARTDNATPTPKPTQTTPATPGRGGGGVLDPILGGMPWWIPAGALGLAVLAGVAAYPRSRRVG